MNPVLAIVGRPNVGKSTLFNKFVKAKHALVLDLPGVTRDRNYGNCKISDKNYIVIDTGGIDEQEGAIESEISIQSWQAVLEADLVLFVVDATTGVTSIDINIAKKLRQLQKPVLLVANKTDGFDPNIAVADFYSLSLGTPIAIAAKSSRNLNVLKTNISSHVLEDKFAATDYAATDSGIKFAVVGRPNVGKSTLTNQLLGEERVVVLDHAGTTRDSIYIPFSRHDKHYTIIDTAGVRKKSKVNEQVEKYSIVKTLQAIKDSNVVLLLIDASIGVSNQDLELLGFIDHAGKSLIIVINKWDLVTAEQKEQIKAKLKFKLKFLHYAATYYVSAISGTGIKQLFKAIDAAYNSAMGSFATPKLNSALAAAVANNEPPLSNGRRIKLRYAHQGDSNPPLIIIHGNQTGNIPENYKRYLMKFFLEELKLFATPIKLEFKTSDNPYKDKKNILTRTQLKKRQRIRGRK